MPAKRRKATCRRCKIRKSRCDGQSPSCSTCIAFKTECRYEAPPSLAYVRDLETKVEQLGSDLAAREAGVARTSRHDNPTNDHDSRYRELCRSRDDISSSEIISNDAEVHQPPPKPADESHWVSQISSDGYGGVSYHNPTSAVHDSPLDNSIPNIHHSDWKRQDDQSQVVSDATSTSTLVDHRRNLLTANAAQSRLFEAGDIQKMLIDSSSQLSMDFVQDLLNLHWCWIHPSFLFVYRPAFMRDMGDGYVTDPREGHYFSDTLFKVLCAHSCRFIDSEDPSMERLKNDLISQSHVSLGRQILEPSSIPAIQALLQLSANETAYGRNSQAWLYSGMAFRMAIDLGLHLPNDSLPDFVKSLTPEDVEIRKRAFWSCYTWDKAISLYLGRMPNFGSYESPFHDPAAHPFLDDYTETELWQPFYGSRYSREEIPTMPFIPVEAKVVSTFTALCQLCVVLHQLMVQIYGSSSSDQSSSGSKGSQNVIATAFGQLLAKFRTWRSNLPSHLWLDTKQLPPQSPPPHVVSLNLLYHSGLILLHRPFVIGPSFTASTPAVRKSYEVCLSATAAIQQLLDLQVRTFGYRHLTYLSCYCAYIAATISVLQSQREDSTTNADGYPSSLKFFLSILQMASRYMPALVRSVGILKKHIAMTLEAKKQQQLAMLFPEDLSNVARREEEVSSTASPPVQPPPPPTNNIFPHNSNPSSSTVQPSTLSMLNPEMAAALPAFPGQQISIGSGFPLDLELQMLDPAVRAALMGSNLDPHIQLNHEMDNWDGNSLYWNDG